MSNGLLNVVRYIMRVASDGRISKERRGLRMGGTCWGYTRDSTWKGAPTREAQLEAIAGYCGARGWPFRAEQNLFADAVADPVPDFRDREAGGVLMGRLRRGDRLIVTSLDRIFHKIADCDLMLRCWDGMGVALHLVDLGGPVHELGAGAMASLIAGMEKAARSERAAASAAKSRYSSRPVNGSPPHGFEWVRRSGQWYLVPDLEERALMKAMLEWYEAGHSIDAIRQHLEYKVKLKFYKQRGRQKRLVRWNSDAIWRRIQAEMRLRLAEGHTAVVDGESASGASLSARGEVLSETA